VLSNTRPVLKIREEPIGVGPGASYFFKLEEEDGRFEDVIIVSIDIVILQVRTRYVCRVYRMLARTYVNVSYTT
jgi:hypothetical protein